jgi:NAD-dependent dihydropyrimidine dehydrogenase PreA subunit
MAVLITNECINCDACVDECPATAIVSADESPLEEAEFTYVKPEKCIECVDCSVPKCFDVCPSEGAIVWDLPYTKAFNEHFVQGHEQGQYAIRSHKKKGLLIPCIYEKPFRESVGFEQRKANEPLTF